VELFVACMVCFMLLAFWWCLWCFLKLCCVFGKGFMSLSVFGGVSNLWDQFSMIQSSYHQESNSITTPNPDN